MSSLTLPLHTAGWQPDQRRILAIAAVVVLHVLLLGQLLMPAPAPFLREPAPPISPSVDLEPLPPAPIRPPEPPPAQITPVRQQITPPPVRIPAPVVTPPQTIVATAAHVEPSAEPPAVVAPWQPPAETSIAAPSEALTVLRTSQPVYPHAALLRGIGGVVQLRIRVDIHGRAAEVQVQGSSGHRMLDDAAVRAVRRGWRFQPATVNGVAVERWGTVDIRFRIDE